MSTQTSTTSRRYTRNLITEIIIFALPVLITQIYFKYTYLHFGGLEIFKRVLNITNLSMFDYARFYAYDFLETLIIVPILLVLVNILFKKYQYLLKFIVIELLIIINVTAWVSYHTIGNFPNIDLISDFFTTLATEPDTVSPFSILEIRQLIKISLLLSLGLIPVILISFKPTHFLLHKFSIIIISLSAFLLLSPLALALTTKQPTTFHRGHLQIVSTNLFPSENIILPETVNYTAHELKEIYNANIFPPNFDLSTLHSYKLNFQPSDISPNIIMIVLETAALDDYSFLNHNSETPNISRLINKSLISENHYSSYPYSIRSNFSLLSSTYDLPSRKMMIDYLIKKKPTKGQSLANILGKDGYKTKYYYPFDLTQGEKERWMLKYFGFNEIWHGLPHKKDNSAGTRIKNETKMFQEAIADINQYTSKSQPFFLNLVSSIGHIPYINTYANKDESDIKDQRKYYLNGLNIFMDKLIGKIVTSLEENNAFKNTILIITSDHGVRNKVEDPKINLSFSNKRSYNVPLLIHYPDAFKSTHKLNWVTSNIDVVPTILSLLQKDTSQYFHQGLPMFNPAIQERTTFFWGGHYFGTNALHSKGKYYMENLVTESSYLNNKYEFNNAINTERTGNTEDIAEKLKNTLRAQVKIQYDWTAYLRGQ